MNTVRDENNCFAKQYNTYDLSGSYGIGYTNKGEEFWFDLEDYDKIKNYCWHFNQWGHLISTERNSNKRVFLHRLIMEPIPDGMVVDHKWHPSGKENKYDNRKANLEIKTNQQNLMNHALYSSNTSGCSGVHQDKKSLKWIARITFNCVRYTLGRFNTFEEAVKARKEAEEKFYGKYSYDNSCIFIGG